MTLNNACINILSQLGNLINQIHEQDFIKQSEVLSQSTIGQHIRHTLEFFLCLESGSSKGVVNYDKRPHDKLIENDKFIALSSVRRIRDFVSGQENDRPLKLEVGYDIEREEFVTIDTTFFRELAYNIEHAVHHMAIVKIGVREVAPYITLDKDFGVAASTIRHKEAIASAPC